MAFNTYDPAKMDAAVAQMRTRVARVAQAWGKDAQERMRAQAPWTDRNGPSRTGLNARQSLKAQTAIAPNGDVLVVLSSDRQTLTPWRSWSSGAPVGAFLELSTRFMAARPILWPTAKAMAPDLIKQVRAELGG
ncbi:MAG TPA: hypothetical protein VE338_07565 [Ktedonobacterales bacterium]|nr:hypothetical protein [Ktedonobacterales bacterium]